MFALKSSRFRYLEFLKGMQLVRDSLDMVRQRKEHYFLSLSAQLRALFILPHDKNGKLKRDRALICYDLAEALNVDLSLYISKKEYANKEYQYYDHLFTTTLEATRENTERLSLVDWLECDIVSIFDKKFKIWEVIKIMADKNGGAHFDEKTDIEIAQLCEARNKAGVLVIHLLLSKVGEVLFKIGLKILKSLFDFQLVISIALPKRESLINKNVISFIYERAYSPISISVTDSNMLSLKLADSEKTFYEFEVFDFNNNIDWSFFVINISYELTEKMRVMLTVYCNNVVSKIELHNPIFIGHIFLRNSKIQFSDKDFKISFSTMLLYKRILNDEQNMQLYESLQTCKNANVGRLVGKQEAIILEDSSMKFLGYIYYEPYNEFIES